MTKETKIMTVREAIKEAMTHEMRWYVRRVRTRTRN